MLVAALTYKMTYDAGCAFRASIIISGQQNTNKFTSITRKCLFLPSSDFSGGEAVWEFPQSHVQWDDKPRRVCWLQTPPAHQLRASDRRSGWRRRRRRCGEEEKEGQLAKPIRTLLHNGREAFRAGAFPHTPHLLHRQHLPLHCLPILLMLYAPKQAGFGVQQRTRCRREGPGGHGCRRWDSEVSVTPQERESAEQQRLRSHGVRWGGRHSDHTKRNLPSCSPCQLLEWGTWWIGLRFISAIWRDRLPSCSWCLIEMNKKDSRSSSPPATLLWSFLLTNEQLKKHTVCRKMVLSIFVVGCQGAGLCYSFTNTWKWSVFPPTTTFLFFHRVLLLGNCLYALEFPSADENGSTQPAHPHLLFDLKPLWLVD